MRDILIALAKAAILVALGEPEDFNLTKALHDYPGLQKPGAVFVTLTQGKDERLRGCIGSLKAWRPLYKDVIFNAQAAALKDSRFPPLKKEELPTIKIEVSLLSNPSPLKYENSKDLKAKIVPGRDGIILRYKNHHATFLPQVWKQLPRFEDFFASLCQKAKLPENCLKLHPEIEVYRVTKYKEQ